MLYDSLGCKLFLGIKAMHLIYESLPDKIELEANIDYVSERSIFISKLVDSMRYAKNDFEKFGLNLVKFHALFDHLCYELLRTETEKQILESDLKNLE